MFRKVVKGLGRVAENPYVSLLVGVVFLYTGVEEMLRDLEALGEMRVGVHHGVILYALLHIFKTLPEFVEGVEYLDRGERREG